MQPNIYLGQNDWGFSIFLSQIGYDLDQQVFLIYIFRLIFLGQSGQIQVWFSPRPQSEAYDVTAFRGLRIFNHDLDIARRDPASGSAL